MPTFRVKALHNETSKAVTLMFIADDLSLVSPTLNAHGFNVLNIDEPTEAEVHTHYRTLAASALAPYRGVFNDPTFNPEILYRDNIKCHQCQTVMELDAVKCPNPKCKMRRTIPERNEIIRSTYDFRYTFLKEFRASGDLKLISLVQLMEALILPPTICCQSCGEDDWQFDACSPNKVANKWSCGFCSRDIIVRATMPAVDSTLANGREPIPKAVQREVWRRDNARCVECGSQERLEFDHIIAVAKGGGNTARNLQLLCETCNRSKSDSPPGMD